MIRLSKPQILRLHEQRVAATGGSDGLRDEGMLDSALSARSKPLVRKTFIPLFSKKRPGFV